MGQIFSLDADTLTVITQALDDIITVLGKDCVLVYPPKMTACPNCVPSPMGGQSSNRWRSGGPVPFPNTGVCPWCNGAGRRAEEQSELVHMSCEWNPKEYKRPLEDVDVRVPYSVLKTKGYLTDLPKIVRCEYLRLQIPVEGYSVRRFKLASNPGDESNIIQGRYCVAIWTQIL